MDKLDLRGGEILEIEMKDKLSDGLRGFVGIVKTKELNGLEEAYYDCVLERSSIRRLFGFFSADDRAIEILDDLSGCALHVNDVVFSEVVYKPTGIYKRSRNKCPPS